MSDFKDTNFWHFREIWRDQCGHFDLHLETYNLHLQTEACGNREKEVSGILTQLMRN